MSALQMQIFSGPLALISIFFYEKAFFMVYLKLYIFIANIKYIENK